MAKLGLVLAGGGGKGAYEIGVWRYLHEIALDRKISVISGTSVGALNAALMGIGDYENAEDIWLNHIEKAILTPHKNDAKKFAVGIAAAYFGSGAGFLAGLTAGAPLEGLNSVALGLGVAAHATVAVTAAAAGGIVSGSAGGAAAGWIVSKTNEIVTNGMFSREGLLEIMKDYVPLEKIQDSPKSVYATCTLDKAVFERILGEKRERVPFRLNKYRAEGMRKILLATSAIPGVFKPETIEGNKYLDGGFAGFFMKGDIVSYMDNVPLTPLVNENCTHAIVVHLDTDAERPVPKDSYNEESDRKSSIQKMIEIVPSRELGGLFTGTLSFAPESVREKLELGYNDAKNIYGKQLLKLLNEFETVNLNSEKSGIEKILRKYIYDLRGFMEEEVYSKEDFSGHEKMIGDFISKSPYKIKLEDVIAFHSGRMIAFTEEGFLFANGDVFNFVFYKEISRVNRNSRSGKWGGNVSFSGKFKYAKESDSAAQYGNCLTDLLLDKPEKNKEAVVSIEKSRLFSDFNSDLLSQFLQEAVESVSGKRYVKNPEQLKAKVREAIADCVMKCDEFFEADDIVDDKKLSKRVAKSLTYCKADISVEDILAYKDISIFGRGADFLLLTEDGIHYKDSGTDYDFIAFNDIAKVNKHDNEVTVIGKSPLQFGPLTPVPHIMTIKYLAEPGILASCLKTVKTLFELK